MVELLTAPANALVVGQRLTLDKGVVSRIYNSGASSATLNYRRRGAGQDGSVMIEEGGDYTVDGTCVEWIALVTDGATVQIDDGWVHRILPSVGGGAPFEKVAEVNFSGAILAVPRTALYTDDGNGPYVYRVGLYVDVKSGGGSTAQTQLFFTSTSGLAAEFAPTGGFGGSPGTEVHEFPVESGSEIDYAIAVTPSPVGAYLIWLERGPKL